VHDHGDAAPAERAVAEALSAEPVQHGHVLRRPVDAPVPFGRKARVGDAGHARRICRAFAPAEWKYVNVRRAFVFAEHSIDQATQRAVFEPNGDDP